MLKYYKDLDNQVEESFYILKNQGKVGYMVSFTDYAAEKKGFVVVPDLYKSLMATFKYCYFSIDFVFDLSKDFSEASIEARPIDALIESHLELTYVKDDIIRAVMSFDKDTSEEKFLKFSDIEDYVSKVDSDLANIFNNKDFDMYNKYIHSLQFIYNKFKEVK